MARPAVSGVMKLAVVWFVIGRKNMHKRILRTLCWLPLLVCLFPCHLWAIDYTALSMEELIDFRAALRIKPDHAATHSNFGTALFRSGKFNDSVLSFQDAVRLVPDSAVFHLNLGLALDRAGRIDEAILHFREALRLQPGFTAARNSLQKALIKKQPANSFQTLESQQRKPRR